MTTEPGLNKGKTEDLAILSSWVKKELFDTVKFIFDPEVDLVEKGHIYKLFVKNCKDRLVGLKLIEESNQALRWLYVNSLWHEATRRKKNLVADGLNAKRSTTYSAMKNGFIELCNLCVKNNAILPSIEAFAVGIEIPSVYMIFYDYFLRTSIGDAAWKAGCRENKDETDFLAPYQGEAYAFLVLKNNYFAWLWEAKFDLKNQLVTDYDSETDREKKDDVGTALLNDMQFNLDEPLLRQVEEDTIEEQQNQESDDEDSSDNDSTESNNTRNGPTDDSTPTKDKAPLPPIDTSDVLIKPSDIRHKTMKRKMEAQLRALRQKVQGNERYKEVHDQVAVALAAGKNKQPAIEHASGEENETNGTHSERNEEAEDHKPSVKKRRLMRTFREFTNPKDAEKRFKGWSNRALKELKQYTLKLKDPGPKERRFRAAYRMVWKSNLKENKKDKVPQTMPSGVEYAKEIWCVEDVEIGEMAVI